MKNPTLIMSRIPVPNKVKELKSQELTSILTCLTGKGSAHLKAFINKCIEGSTKSIVNMTPVGNNADYYNWGFQKGLLKAHELYRDLEGMLEDEMINREKDKEEKEENK
jgi:hypothetical protein